MATGLEAVAVEQGVELLFAAVSKAANKITTLNSKPKHLKEFLNSVKPMCDEIDNLNKMLNGPNEKTDMFFNQLKRVEELVRKSSKTKWWDVIQKIIYSNELIDLEASMLRFLQTVVPVLLYGNSLKILARMNNMDEKLNQILLILKIPVGGVDNSSKCACLGELRETKEGPKKEEHQEKKNHNQQKNRKDDDNKKDDQKTKNQNQQKNNMKDANNKKDDWGDEISTTFAVLKINLLCACENCPKNVIKAIQSLKGVIVIGYHSDMNMLTVELMVVGKVDRLELREKVEQKTKRAVELVELSTLPKKEKDNDKEKWGKQNKKTDDKENDGAVRNSSGFSWLRFFRGPSNHIVALDEALEQSEVVQVRETKEGLKKEEPKKTKNNDWQKNKREEGNEGKDINTTVVVLKINLNCPCDSCPKKVLRRIGRLKGEGVTIVEHNIDEKKLMVKLMAVGKVGPSELREKVNKTTKNKFEVSIAEEREGKQPTEGEKEK